MVPGEFLVDVEPVEDNQCKGRVGVGVRVRVTIRIRVRIRIRIRIRVRVRFKVRIIFKVSSRMYQFMFSPDEWERRMDILVLLLVVAVCVVRDLVVIPPDEAAPAYHDVITETQNIVHGTRVGECAMIGGVLDTHADPGHGHAHSGGGEVTRRGEEPRETGEPGRQHNQDVESRNASSTHSALTFSERLHYLLDDACLDDLVKLGVTRRAGGLLHVVEGNPGLDEIHDFGLRESSKALVRDGVTEMR